MRELTDKLAGPQEDVEAERQIREENYELTLRKISESINLFYQQLAQEKKVQEDLDHALLQNAEQMASLVRSEVAKERRDRELTEQVRAVDLRLRSMLRLQRLCL